MAGVPLPRIVTGSAVLTLAFAAIVLLSDGPAWHPIPADAGVVKLSFSHGADRRAACREPTAEELAALPPNMRMKQICPRRRPPVHVELDIDGSTVYRATLEPSGIAGDGPSRVYEKFVLPAGRHDIAVRLRDRPDGGGFDHASEREVDLAAGRSFVIEFSPGAGGFVFR